MKKVICLLGLLCFSTNFCFCQIKSNAVNKKESRESIQRKIDSLQIKINEAESLRSETIKLWALTKKVKQSDSVREKRFYYDSIIQQTSDLADYFIQRRDSLRFVKAEIQEKERLSKAPKRYADRVRYLGSLDSWSCSGGFCLEMYHYSGKIVVVEKEPGGLWHVTGETYIPNVY